MHLSERPLTRADFGDLGRWLGEGHVSRWWDPRHDAEFLESKYGPRIDGDESTEVFVLEVDGFPVGLYQWCPADEYAWWPTELGLAEGAVVIDALIGDPACVGRGVGSALLGRIVSRLPERFPEARRILACTDAGNVSPCRVLENGGFQLVHKGELVRDQRPVSRIYALELGAGG